MLINESEPTQETFEAIAGYLNTQGKKDHYGNWWTWEGIQEIWEESQDQQLKALIRILGDLWFGS